MGVQIKIEKANNVAAFVNRVQADALENTMENAQELAKENVPYASGKLHDNIGFTGIPQTGGNIESDLYADTFYAAYIETGNPDLMGPGESVYHPSQRNTGNRGWLRNGVDGAVVKHQIVIQSEWNKAITTRD